MARKAVGAATMSDPECGATHRQIKSKLLDLYDELFRHNGYGEMHLEIRFLNRGQKEVIIRCGKQYRYIVDYRNAERRRASLPYEGVDRRHSACREKGENETASSEESGREPNDGEIR